MSSDPASLDAQDPLTKKRDLFEIPLDREGNEQAYFAGNSLGLLPKRARTSLLETIDQWGSKGVAGQFDGEEAWYR